MAVKSAERARGALPARRRGFPWVKVSVSLALVAYLFWGLHWGSIWGSLANLRWG